MNIIAPFRFATKVWLTSVFLSPVLIISYFLIWEPGDFDPSGILCFLLLMVFFGGFLSIPNWLFLMIGVFAINQSPLHMPIKRVLIQGLGIFLTLGLYWILFRDAESQGFLPVIGVYMATVCFGIGHYSFDDQTEVL